jgi:AcrR family transcriptional regulator
MTTRTPRKPQARTAVTRDLLLRAAEQVFARVGYERAQMEEIAAAAGYSKGGLYAHFTSKEDLFLALYQAKTAGYRANLHHALDRATTRPGKIDAFRRFYIDLSRDREWALLVIEVKLFIRRHPEARARLRVNNGIEDAWSRLFGASARAAGEALGGMFSALVLEAELEPDVLTERKLRAMLGTIFDALTRPRASAAASST